MSESFKGVVKTQWNNDNHRDMTLLESISYTDPSGTEWAVPEGSFLNGATIPRSLWTVVGSPYTGAYRRASIIHDYYVGEGTNPEVTPEQRKKADKMFYNACRFDGCSKREAAVLYIGVRTGSWFATHKPAIDVFEHKFMNLEVMKLDVEVETSFKKTFYKLEDELDEMPFELLEQKVDTILSKHNITSGESELPALPELIG